MDAYYMSWKNKLCKYRPQHGVNETSFKLTTTVGVHMNVILGNLKALGLTYNGKEFSVDYTTYNNKAFDVQKRFLIEYGSISILDALNAICSEDALNCEWWIDGSIIYLGYCEMEGQTTFEQDVNVLSMSYSESSQLISRDCTHSAQIGIFRKDISLVPMRTSPPMVLLLITSCS